MRKSQRKYNRIKNMKTRKAFNEAHPQLNEAQQQSAYHMTQIDGWEISIEEPTYTITLTKEGRTLTLQENGCAL